MSEREAPAEDRLTPVEVLAAIPHGEPFRFAPA